MESSKKASYMKSDIIKNAEVIYYMRNDGQELIGIKKCEQQNQSHFLEITR
jgi:hypothetical protein